MKKNCRKKLNQVGETGLSDREQGDVYYYRNRAKDAKDLPKGATYTTDKETAVETYEEKMARADRRLAGEYTETGTIVKDGKKLSSVKFPNEKALKDLPKELRPQQDVMGPTVLTSLAKKGFIKIAKVDGISRWVPVDYKDKQKTHNNLDKQGLLKRKKEIELLLTAVIASKPSKDPSTKCGSGIFDANGKVLSTGFNTFPDGIPDSMYADRAYKYKHIVHAEVSAITAAKEKGVPLHNKTLSVFPLPPCINCMKAIHKAGIKSVITQLPTAEQMERWGDSVNESLFYAEKNGIAVKLNSNSTEAQIKAELKKVESQLAPLLTEQAKAKSYTEIEDTFFKAAIKSGKSVKEARVIAAKAVARRKASDQEHSQKSASKKKTNASTKKKSKAAKQAKMDLNQTFKDQNYKTDPLDITKKDGTPFKSKPQAQAALTIYAKRKAAARKDIKLKDAKQKMSDSIISAYSLVRYKEGWIARPTAEQNRLVKESRDRAIKKGGDKYSKVNKSLTQAMQDLGTDPVNIDFEDLANQEGISVWHSDDLIGSKELTSDLKNLSKANKAEIEQWQKENPDIKLSITVDGSLGGFYLNGQIYLIKENLKTAADVLKVFLHEGGHLLVDKDASFQKIYNGIIKSFDKHLKTDKILQEKYEFVKENYAEKDWVEETIMHYIQHFADKKVPKKGFIREIITKMRIWIAKTFGAGVKLDGYELAQIVRHKLERILDTKLEDATKSTGPKATYVSVKAKTEVQQKSLSEANKMRAQGKTNLEIYEETGWFKAEQDGKWRGWLNDDDAYIKSGAYKNDKLSKILVHPELYKNYPELKDIPVNLDIGTPGTNSGLTDIYYSDVHKEFRVKLITVAHENEVGATQVLLHEVQHVIQTIEELARGGAQIRRELLTEIETLDHDAALETVVHAMHKTGLFTQKINDKLNKNNNRTTPKPVDTIMAYNKLHEIVETAKENKTYPSETELQMSILPEAYANLAPAIETLNYYNDEVFLKKRYKMLAGEQEGRDVMRKYKAITKALPKLMEENLVSLVSKETAREIVTAHQNENIMGAILEGAKKSGNKDIKKTAEMLSSINEPVRGKEEQTTSFWSRIFSSSEYSMKIDPTSSRVQEPAMNEDFKRHEMANKILGNFLSFQRGLAGTFNFGGKKILAALNTKVSKYIVDTDRTGKGFRTKAIQEEQKLDGVLVDGVLLDRKIKYYAVINRDGKQMPTKHKTKADAIIERNKLEQAYLEKQGFNANAKQMVQNARDLTDRAFNVLIADLAGTIAELKKHGVKLPTRRIKMEDGTVKKISLEQAKIEMGNLQGTYFPRERPQTTYSVVTKKGKGVSRKRLRRNFAAHFVQNKNSWKATNWVREQANKLTAARRVKNQLIREDWDVKIEIIKTPTDLVFDTPKLLASMSTILTEAAKKSSKGVKDVGTDKALQELFTQLTGNISQLFATRSTMSSRARRQEKHWEGYETDVTKALTSYAHRIAASETRKLTAREMVLAFTGRDKSFELWVKEHPADEHTEANYREYCRERAIDPIKQKKLWEDTQTFISHFLKPNNTTANAIGYFKTLAVLWYLGFRVSSPAVNMTNMVTGVIGTMSAKTGIGIVKSWKLVGHAASTYGRYQTELLRKTRNINAPASKKVTKEEREVYNYITLHGWDAPLYNYEAEGMMSNTFGKAFNGVTKAAMLVFGQSEKANRAMTIKAGFDAVRQSKHTELVKMTKDYTEASNKENKAKAFDLLMKEAKKISDNAHGTYTKAAKPWLIQKYKLLDLPYTFMKFSHNYALNLYNIGFNEGQVKEALYLLAAPAFVAGAGASMATPVLNMLFSGIWDDPEEEFYDYIEQATGSDTFARFGAIGALGFSFKGSLQANLPKYEKSWDLLGAPGSVIADWYDAYGHFRYGETSKGFEDLLPAAFGNVKKGMREAEEGITLQSYGKKFYGKKQITITPFEEYLRYFSLAPIRLQKIQEKQWSDKQIRTKYERMRRRLYSRYKAYLAKPFHKRDPGYLIKLENKRNHYNSLVNTLDQKRKIPYITTKGLARNLKAANTPDIYERNR